MERESDLVVQLQRGDEAALAELYERLGANIYTLAKRLLKSHEEAEEVVQDTFLKLFEADSYNAQHASPRAYIYTIARNLALSRLRKRSSRPLKADAWDVYDPSSSFAVSAPNHPTDKLLVEKLLEQLADDERTLLEHNFYDGLTHAQLSEQTGLPLGTVKSKLRRALIKLRDYWETL